MINLSLITSLNYNKKAISQLHKGMDYFLFLSNGKCDLEAQVDLA